MKENTENAENMENKSNVVSETELISRKMPWQVLGWILVVGLILRTVILAVFGGETLQIVDETHYNNLAVLLAETGNYLGGENELTSIRPPLYPWVVSVIYHFFGMENYTAVRVFQILVSLLTTLAVYGLAREWDGFLSPRGALWVATLFCFYPSLVVENFFLLTETLFTFWLVLVLWTASRFLRTGSLYATGFCGVFIALGALTRSILWLSPIPLVVFILFFPNQNKIGIKKEQFTWKRRILGAVFVLLFAGVGMAPWMIRNTRVQETFTAIDCMSGRNLMMGNYEYTPLYRAWDAISAEPPYDWYTVLRKRLATEKEIALDPLTQGEKDRWASWYAKEFVRENPGLTLKRDMMKSLCFWQLERSIPAGIERGFWGTDKLSDGRRKVLFFGVTALIQLAYTVLFLLAVLGVCAMRYRGNWVPGIVLMFAVVLYFWVLHSLSFAHERYHLPVVPIMIMMAVYMAENFRVGVLRLRQNWVRMVVATAISAVFVGFWVCEIVWMLI